MNDKIVTEDRVSKTPFSRWNSFNRAIHTFDDNQKIKRDGKELTLQEYMNENNHDCTIYQVLNTYRGDLHLTTQKMNTLTHKVAQDLSQVNNLRDALTIMKNAEQSWRELPLEVRKEFNNDVSKFQRDGLSWANKKIAEYNKKIEESNTIKEQTTNE